MYLCDAENSASQLDSTKVNECILKRSLQDSSDSIDENTPDIEPEENRLLTVPKQENCLDDSKKPIQKPRADKSERKKCRVCDCSERCNPQLKPEIFVECSDCRRTGMYFPRCACIVFHLENEYYSNIDICICALNSSSHMSEDVNTNGTTN